MEERKMYVVKDASWKYENMCLYIEETDEMYEVWVGAERYGIRDYAVGVSKKDFSLESVLNFDFDGYFDSFMEMYEKVEDGALD